MKIILDNSLVKNQLFPFTKTRHAADIRVGIITIREKLLYNKQHEVFDSYEDYSAKYPGLEEQPLKLPANLVTNESCVTDSSSSRILNYPWDIFKYNDWALHQDFVLITQGRISQEIAVSNKTINSADIFIEDGARLEHCILNASEGPIYIGKNALIMEGTMIRGPVAVCEGAVVKMGTRIYGATTIGPFCTVAGEIKNSVFFGYSNKAHDGYLGDSVIGEWCNLGAGTSNSNVKNNAGEVKYYVEAEGKAISTGLKGGLLMGDYSKAAINTSFNTGTVVGVCCNVFTMGLTPAYIPDFSWGVGTQKYELHKAMIDIDNWKRLKGLTISENEKQILTDIYKP